MLHNEIITLSKIRLEKAKECLEDSRSAKNDERYKMPANRSYYSVFNAMRACLALENIDHKSHKGVISDFRKLFIKTGKIRPELSKTIDELSDSRTQSDYDDFYVISRDDVIAQFSKAEKFISDVEIFLFGYWNDISG